MTIDHLQRGAARKVWSRKRHVFQDDVQTKFQKNQTQAHKYSVPQFEPGPSSSEPSISRRLVVAQPGDQAFNLRLRGGARVGRSGGTTQHGGLTFQAVNGRSVDVNTARGLGSDGKSARGVSKPQKAKPRKSDLDDEDSIEFSEDEGGSSQDQYEDDFVSEGEESFEGSLEPKDALLDDSDSAQFSEEEEIEVPVRRPKRAKQQSKVDPVSAPSEPVDASEVEKALKIMQMVGMKADSSATRQLAVAFISGMGVLEDKSARTAQFRAFLKACKANASFLKAVNEGQFAPKELLEMKEAAMLAHTVTGTDD